MKLTMQQLGTSFKTSTVKLLFPELIAFIQDNNFRYLQNATDILVALDQDHLSTQQLMQVQQRLDEKQAADALAAEAAERDRKDEEEIAARKALQAAKLSGASVTSMSSTPWRQ